MALSFAHGLIPSTRLSRYSTSASLSNAQAPMIELRNLGGSLCPQANTQSHARRGLRGDSNKWRQSSGQERLRRLRGVHSRGIQSRAVIQSRAAVAQVEAGVTEIGALVEWVREKAGLSSDAVAKKWAVEARRVPGEVEMGWGLYARRDLGVGEEVLTVPESVCLGIDNVMSNPETAPLSSLLSPWAAVAVLLLLEKSKGETSQWAPYISTLPSASSLNSPVLWTTEELAELEGTQVLGSVQQYKEAIAAQYEALQGTPLSTGVDLQSLTWAFAILRSRCFPPCTGNNIALTPLLDLVNHGRVRGVGKEGPAMEWVRCNLSSQGDKGMLGGFLKGLQAGPPAYGLVTLKSCKAGDQVVLEYGEDKSNGDLLLDYGFVESEAALPSAATPQDSKKGIMGSLAESVGIDFIGGAAAGAPESVARRGSKAEKEVWAAEAAAERRQVYLLTLEIPPGDKNFDDKADILEQAGLGCPHTFDLRLPQPASDSLLAFLRLATLSGPDSFLLEALFRNDVWYYLQLPISRENEEAVCRAMIEGCQEALSAYPTSISQDEAILEKGGMTERGQMAVVVRLGEKRVLSGILSSFEGRLSALDSLEYYPERRLRDLGLMDETGNMTPWATAD